jgi:tRNA(adenine34) deaminase
MLCRGFWAGIASDDQTHRDVATRRSNAFAYFSPTSEKRCTCPAAFATSFCPPHAGGNRDGTGAKAIEVARRNPNAPFGALLVDGPTGQIVAEGLNRWQENPTWHGEIDAINRCALERPRATWSRLRLNTTAEPCCMCLGAVLWAGIPEVVYGTSIETLMRLGWSQIDIPSAEVARRTTFATCSLMGGVLEAECDTLFQAARQS